MKFASILESLTAVLFPHGELERQLAKQPLLDREAFYREYYAGTGIPDDIPERVRAVLAYQLGASWMRIRPTDKPGEIAYDVDIGEIIFELEEEFGVKIPVEPILESGGSFDSIVHCLASALAPLRRETP